MYLNLLLKICFRTFPLHVFCVSYTFARQHPFRTLNNLKKNTAYDKKNTMTTNLYTTIAAIKLIDLMQKEISIP